MVKKSNKQITLINEKELNRKINLLEYADCWKMLYNKAEIISKIFISGDKTMDKIEYHNDHIILFICFIIISLLMPRYGGRLITSVYQGNYIVYFNLYTISIMLVTSLIMALIVYNLPIPCKGGTLFFWWVLFLSAVLGAFVFLVSDVIYVLGPLIAVPGFIMSYKPYKVTMDDSEIQFYSFSRKDKKVVIKFDKIKKMEIYHYIGAVKLGIITEKRTYFYDLNRRKKAERIINRLFLKVVQNQGIIEEVYKDKN